MNIFQVVHSLNVVTQVPMTVVDESAKILSKYNIYMSSEEINSIPVLNLVNQYNRKNYKTFNIELTDSNELYITFKIESYYLICGPFNYKKLYNKGVMESFKFKTCKAYNLRYSFSDLREFIYIAQSMLGISHTYPFEKEVLELSAINLLNIKREYAKDIQKLSLDSVLTQKKYEDAILENVMTGNLNKVIETSKKLSNSITPDLSYDALRSEKNYSIIVFEKLSHSAIKVGCPEKDALYLRDYYIKETDKLKNALEVLKLRNAAIILFTQLVDKNIVNVKTALIRAVINYIHTNITLPLKVSELASYFSVHETTLRRRFKAEINISLSQYIIIKKVEESKILLEQKYSVSDISNLLGFYDSSHFSKSFKKHFGITPNKYKKQFLV
ncbi:YSIRK-targeted surface antigen transcriptional regulator [Erysipelothrix rhusiopathiae]|nr:YSIRK-targeted surface antigen transcriptional regulator [Erysipelothrix rhusiopathiae]